LVVELKDKYEALNSLVVIFQEKPLKSGHVKHDDKSQKDYSIRDHPILLSHEIWDLDIADLECDDKALEDLVTPQKEECIVDHDRKNDEGLEELVSLHEEESLAHPKNE